MHSMKMGDGEIGEWQQRILTTVGSGWSDLRVAQPAVTKSQSPSTVSFVSSVSRHRWHGEAVARQYQHPGRPHHPRSIPNRFAFPGPPMSRLENPALQ